MSKRKIVVLIIAGVLGLGGLYLRRNWPYIRLRLMPSFSTYTISVPMSPQEARRLGNLSLRGVGIDPKALTFLSADSFSSTSGLVLYTTKHGNELVHDDSPNIVASIVCTSGTAEVMLGFPGFPW